jgi:hypothetical protein
VREGGRERARERARARAHVCTCGGGEARAPPHARVRVGEYACGRERERKVERELVCMVGSRNCVLLGHGTVLCWVTELRQAHTQRERESASERETNTQTERLGRQAAREGGKEGGRLTFTPHMYLLSTTTKTITTARTRPPPCLPPRTCPPLLSSLFHAADSTCEIL